MTDILHHSGTNPDERKKIETEQEAWRTVNAMFESEKKEFTKALNKKDQAINEKDQELKENRQVLNEKDQTITVLFKKLEEKNNKA